MQTDTKIGSKQYHIQKIFGYDTILCRQMQKKGSKQYNIQKIFEYDTILIQKSKTITNKDKNILTINIYILTFLTQIHTDYYMFTYLLHPNNTEKIINAKNIQKKPKNKFKNGIKGLRNLKK